LVISGTHISKFPIASIFHILYKVECREPA